jgi:two-component system response regulator AtoC
VAIAGRAARRQRGGAAERRSGPELPLRSRVEGFERKIIAEQFAAARNNQSETARRLGVSRPALVEKLHKYGLL